MSAFGREWPTGEAPPLLTARATFDGAGHRTGLVFAAADPVALSVPIRTSTSGPLVFKLPVELATAVPGEFRLIGNVSSDKGLSLSVQLLDPHGNDVGLPVVATPELEQGLYSAFLLDASDTTEPGVPTGTPVTTGTGVLALWAEGDLAAPHLGALLVRESHDSTRSATLGTMTVSGPCVSLEVLASTAGATGEPVWRRSEFVTWRLRPAGPSQAFELLLVDQYLSDDLNPSTDDTGPAPAAWLGLTDPHPPAWGPLRLSATRPAKDVVRLEPEASWYLATRAALPSADAPPPTEVLAFPGGPRVWAFVPPADSTSEPERFQLTFTGSDFELKRLDPEEVPLDACLDGDATRPALAPGRRAPRLALAGEATDALRLALPTSDLRFFPVPALTPGGLPDAQPAGAGHLWSLAPLVQVGDRLLARRPRALPLTTSQPGPPRVENALLAHRPPSLNASGPVPDAPDADMPPPGFPDPTAPLAGLLSATGDADALLLTVARLRTLLDALARRAGAAPGAPRGERNSSVPGRSVAVLRPPGGGNRQPSAPADFTRPGPGAKGPRSPGAGTHGGVRADVRRGGRPTPPASRRGGPAGAGGVPDLRRPPDVPPVGRRRPLRSRPHRPVRPPGAQPADADDRPRRLFLREATAFAAKAPLPFVPDETPSDSAHNFLPGALEFLWAADKPGGMIHHAIQPRTKLDATTALGGLSDWAQRDPERFRPPAGAAVTITRGTFTQAADLPGLLRADVGWDDVLGTVLLDDSAANPAVRLADTFCIRLTTGGGYLLETSPRDAVPLRLITIIDQEVVEIGRDDAAFPVTTGRAAKIYLVAAFAGLTSPLTSPDGTVFLPFIRLVLKPPPPPSPPPPPPPLPQVKVVALADLFDPPVTAEGLTLWTFRPGA